MEHFVQRNFQGILGAGGPKKPDPPPPPILQPPRLGDLQAISSYEYVESIDLISDGMIDGWVNQRGEYVEDLRLFESIYLNDVPVKISLPSDSGTQIGLNGNLNFIGDSLTGLFYPDGLGGNYDNSTTMSDMVTSLGNSIAYQISGSVYANIEYEYLSGRNIIAGDILNKIKNAKTSFQSDDGVLKTQSKIFLGKFGNYVTLNQVSNGLLPMNPNILSENYPFGCLRLNFHIPLMPQTGYINEYATGYASFANTENTNIIVSDDIANYSFSNFEADQIQKQEYYSPPKKINLTYFTDAESASISGIDSTLTGSMYLFFDIEKNANDVFIPTKSAIDSIIYELKNFKIADSFSKFNVSNAMFEVRRGESLQLPLSLFSKTYNDINYSTRLKGPFAKGVNLTSIPRNGFKTIDASFDESKYEDGTINKSFLEGIDDLEALKLVHTALWPSDDAEEAVFAKEVLAISKNAGIPRYLGKGLIRLKGDNSDSLTFTFSRGFREDDKSYIELITYYFHIGTGYFKKFYTRKLSAEQKGTNVNFLANNSVAITSENVFLVAPDNVAFSNKYYQLKILRFCLEQAGVAGGSDDSRPTIKKYAFDDWNKNYVNYTQEQATPLTHYVDNPNVSSVYVTIGLRVLKDTAETQLNIASANEKGGITSKPINAGDPIPSVIIFRIETGYQDKNGNESDPFFLSTYQIKGYAESQATIDIGRIENALRLKGNYNRFILGTQNIAQPITLPEPVEGKARFVRITRMTHESYSTLVKREIYVEKISEIVNTGFSYPYSAVAGLKLDARTLAEIPSRSYDARFKKVFVPSNYFPLKSNGVDKRYIAFSDLAAFNALSSSDRDKIVYQGNWDGTFKLAWTDNPVWIVFDLLTNRRYGLGNFISPEQVNYWELYKIGRFCDAVDENGVFVGVPASDGGLETRYSFNGVIADKTNVFDALKSIIASFRGNLFYSNSEINFTNDRLKPIMAFFNNSNVKDGFFNYTNERKDLAYNVAEVSYLDKSDFFKEKIEYVENQDDIKDKGLLRTSAQTMGVTSKSLAKRIGQHILYSTINEDQNVSFTASNEILFCRPGDLISINDEVKTFKRVAGRVIDIDTGNYVLTTNISLDSASFSSSGLLPEVSVLIATGKLQSADFYDLAKSPQKLSVSDIYQTDVPIMVTFPASGTGVSDSPSAVSYGSKFYIDPATATGAPLFENIKIGSPCSITLSNTKQEIYKIQSIKELNLNEYEVFASKFDTGKFSEIETSETLDSFFSVFPNARITQVNEGESQSLQNKYKFGLTGVPLFINVATGDFDAQADVIDISGQWQEVEGADVYDVDLYVPGKPYFNISGTLVPYLRQTVETNYAIFYDRSEIGQFTMKVRARTTGDYPNEISATQTSGVKIVSYQPPTYTNAFIFAMSQAK